MSENLGITVVPDETTKAVERVYREWDRAWSDDDLGARPDSHRDGQLLQGSRLRLPLRG
jgi:hypothetical protein